MERLQKVIASSGYCSRRKAEELILAGKVSVNGKMVNTLGSKVSYSDTIIINGVTLKLEPKEYVLLYKPRGVVSSAQDDKGRKTVVDIVESKNRLYPVGRLDYDTSGAIILTNDGERIHTATAGGLLCVSLSQPVLDYANLLALTGYLTQDPKDVEEMYRRMIFNYLTDNKDDHCKNFSFMVRKDDIGKWRWRLAPAYDLTLCTEGYNGQHATSVNQTGFPTLKDFISVGTKTKMNEKRCREIFDEVYQNCGDLLLNVLK